LFSFFSLTLFSYFSSLFFFFSLLTRLFSVYECSVFDDDDVDDNDYYHIHRVYSLQSLRLRWASTDVYGSIGKHTPVWLFFFFYIVCIYIYRASYVVTDRSKITSSSSTTTTTTTRTIEPFNEMYIYIVHTRCIKYGCWWTWAW
jgi:hypothetical protein